MAPIHRRVLLAALLSWLTSPGLVGAQSFVGRLVDGSTDLPLGNTSVMLMDTAGAIVDVAASDSTGWFALGAPEPGAYRIFADPLAYAEIVSHDLHVAAGGTVEVELRMTPVPVQLEGLVVSTERRRMRLEKEGFYRRRDFGFGYHWDDEEIAAERPIYTTDLFRMVPGARVRFASAGDYGYVVTFRGIRGMTECQPLYVLDGWTLDLAGSTIDGFVDPAQIIGLEVYPRGVGAPARYRALGSQCGVVVIWTR